MTYIPGLESYLEYNGIFLHQRVSSGVVQPELYRVTSLDVYSVDVRDDREVNPGQHGETAFNSFFGGRPIVIEGRIEALNISSLRVMISELVQAFSGLEEKALYMRMPDSADDVYINCRMVAPIAIKEAQDKNRPWRDFMITLRASDPRFYSVNPADIFRTAPNETTQLARTYDKTYTSYYTAYIDTNNNVVTTPSVSSCINNGNFYTPPVIFFKGTMTNPTITNLTTGQSMSFTVTLGGVGEPGLRVDVANKLIYATGGANQFSTLSPSSEWLYLAPGSNDIRLTVDSFAGSASSTHVQIIYSHAYI